MFFPLHNALVRLSQHIRVNKTLDIFRKIGLTKNQLLKLHSPESQFGIVSPYLDGLSRNQNKQRRTEFVEILNAYGHPWESVNGAYESVTRDTGYTTEKGAVIHNIPFNEIDDMARYFDQESFIYKPVGGRLALYNMDTRTAVVMTELGADMEAPRERYKEEHVPITRWRDVEIEYAFDFANPVSFEEASTMQE